MAKPVVPRQRELELANAARLHAIRWKLAPVLLALLVLPYDFPIPGTTIVLSSLAWIFIALFIVVMAIALSRGSKGGKGVIGKGAGYAIAALGVVIGLAAVLTLTPTAPGPVPGPTGQVTLGLAINPSVDTTVSYPAGSYTACTSATLTSSNGAKTAAGVVWSAMSGATGAVYNQGSTPISGTFVYQTGAQNPVSGGGGKMIASCYQMKFIVTYSNVPTASGGGAVALPLWVYLNSVSESSGGLNTNPFQLSYNNGSLTQLQVFPSNNGLADFPVYLKDGAGSWATVCPNLRSLNFNTLTPANFACAGYDANLARSTGTLTITLDVIMNLSGPFGYSATSGSGDSPVGSTVTMSFTMGLPCSLTNAGLGNACTPTLASYQLVLTRSQA